MYGYSRKYAEKILEYDIVFKLASSSISSPEEIFTQAAELSANNASF